MPSGPTTSTTSPFFKPRSAASDGDIHTKFSVVVSRNHDAAMVRCVPFVRAFQLMNANGRSAGRAIGVPSAKAIGAVWANPSKFSPVNASFSEAVFGS